MKENHDLNKVAKQFSEWRRIGKKRNYPKGLWNEAIRLTDRLSIKEIARAIGICPSHLRKKTIASRQMGAQFIEVVVDSYRGESSIVSAKISGKNGSQMEISYHGTPKDLLPLANQIFGGSL